MFGLFKKPDEIQIQNIDKLIKHFMFVLEGHSYVKEKLIEHGLQQGIKASSLMTGKKQFKEIRDALIKESTKAKTKSWNFCETYIFDILKPSLAEHEAHFTRDREKYEEITGEKFHKGIVEDAKDNGWSPWE